MKRLAFFLAAAALVGFSACSKDRSALTTDNTSAIVKKGTWKITQLIDNNQDETSNYSGYEFTFEDDGTAKGVKSSTTQSGTWATRMDGSTLKMDLNFTESSIWGDITDDWEVIEQSNDIIKLHDLGGGNGDHDYLTFEKI